MSGPSHGSPVGDSLWNENDPVVDACGVGDEAATSRSSSSLYGIAHGEHALRAASAP